MAKRLNLSKTVYELVQQYPELPEVMAQIGFTDITKPMALKTVGRVMTIPKGCVIKGINPADAIRQLEAAGFTVTASDDEPEAPAVPAVKAAAPAEDEAAETLAADRDRVAQIKGLISRLTAGEDLESVKADFVEGFADVDASEIMDAEQQLIAEGTPLEEVTRLCDVHSALFHGATRAEIDGGDAQTMVERMEAAVAAAAAAGKFDTPAPEKNAPAPLGNHAMAAAVDPSLLGALIGTPGHPLQVLTAENDAISRVAAETMAALDAGDRDAVLAGVQTLRQVAVHYAKKGDLLYPMLANRYGITGPSNVMWTVDGEIRDELRSLAADQSPRDWSERARAVVQRVQEMVYKEANILFALCADNFSEQEWRELAFDLGDYAPCLTEPQPVWSEATPAAPPAPSAPDAIVLPTGTIRPNELDAMLRAMPGEVTFVGADDTNQLFDSEPHKDFKRPLTALGRPVWSCHPPKVHRMVRWLIDGFRDGSQDSFEVWAKRDDRDMLVRYIAVRDTDGTYLGTLEFVQDMTIARDHYAKEAEVAAAMAKKAMDSLEERQDQEW